jgi:hypothetical protein
MAFWSSRHTYWATKERARRDVRNSPQSKESSVTSVKLVVVPPPDTTPSLTNQFQAPSG